MRGRKRQRALVERARRRTGVLAMLSTLEGELPRTRGPNPLFWTHTLAHLSLAPDHLQLTLPPPPRAPYTLVVPTAAFPAFYGTPTPSNPSPTADTAHCPECCVVASSGVLLPHLPLALSARPPRSILYNYPAYITKVAAKLFPPPRETAPFSPLLANSEPVRLTLFLSSRAPLARMRFIGVVFRPCRNDTGMPAFQEYSVFASSTARHHALLLTLEYICKSTINLKKIYLQKKIIYQKEDAVE